MASAIANSVSLSISSVTDRSLSCIKSNGPNIFVSFSGLRADGPRATVSISVASSRRKSTSVRASTTVAPTFTSLKPLADRVLVKIQTADEKTSGGILLPSSAQTKPQGGEVVAIGDGRTIGDKKIPISIELGSNIVYSKYAGTEVEFNGKAHLILKEDDVIGVLNTDDIKDLIPAGDRVLIKITESESKSAGGVLLTESAKEKPVVGTVVAVGPGPIGEDGSRKPLDLQVNNVVLYSKFAGNDFKSKDGSPFVILRSQDVVAILS